jgi:hypothetical protein
MSTTFGWLSMRIICSSRFWAQVVNTREQTGSHERTLNRLSCKTFLMAICSLVSQSRA